jgi:DNA mismatch repair ATPase MutS
LSRPNLNTNAKLTKRPNQPTSSSRSSTTSNFSTYSNKLVESLPKEFIKITKMTKTVHFTTKKLIQLNERAQETSDDILLLSNRILNDLIKDIIPFMSCFSLLNECVTFIDITSSLANYHSTASTFSSSIEPVFKNGYIILKDAKHPIINYYFNSNNSNSDQLRLKNTKNKKLKNVKYPISSNGGKSEHVETFSSKTVQNSIEINTTTPLVIITGANMSGKVRILNYYLFILLFKFEFCFRQLF